MPVEDDLFVIIDLDIVFDYLLQQTHRHHRIIRKHFLLIQIITIRAIEITDGADRFKHHIKPQRAANL